MLNETQFDELLQIFEDRQTELTAYIFTLIGKKLKETGTLTATQVRQLNQLQKYGTVEQDIIKEISKANEFNIETLYNVFVAVGKNEYKQATKHIDSDKINREPVNRLIKAMAKQTENTLTNLSKTTIIDKQYRNIIDKAVQSVATGVTDYQATIYKSIKELGEQGIQVEYESGTKRKLDAAIRMNVLDSVRQLSNDVNMQLGKQYGSNGVEISVHAISAPDHVNIQGKQFTYNEFDKLQNQQIAIDVQGKKHPAMKRAISNWNCRHFIFNIIVGVSKPTYSNEELQKMKKNSEKIINYKGIDYTMYEATQRMRAIERLIKEDKLTHILAVSAGNKRLIAELQANITSLTNEYRSFAKVAGLKDQLATRARVSGYKRVKTGV